MPAHQQHCEALTASSHNHTNTSRGASHHLLALLSPRMPRCRPRQRRHQRCAGVVREAKKQGVCVRWYFTSMRSRDAGCEPFEPPACSVPCYVCGFMRMCMCVRVSASASVSECDTEWAGVATTKARAHSTHRSTKSTTVCCVALLDHIPYNRAAVLAQRHPVNTSTTWSWA